jgi:peptidoglycan pentaglycine glycine transferase (the first glycine)
VVQQLSQDVCRLRVESVADRCRWNALVAGLPDYALEQGFEWGEILRHSGCEPHRYAVFDEHECMAAAMVLSWHAPTLPWSVLYAPRGPLIRGHAGLARGRLAHALKQLARAKRAIFLRVSPGAVPTRDDLHADLLAEGFVRLPEEWTVWNAPKIVMTLGMEASVDAMWRRISSSRRREIKAAQAAAVTVVDGGDPRDLGTLYGLLVQMGRRKHYPVRRREHFDAVWREYRAAGAGVLLFARHRDQIVGGLLGARLGRKAYYLYSAIARGDRADAVDLHPGPLLHWHFIQWASANNCESIHWGGSGTQLPPVPADPGYGVYQFKKSLGSECVEHLGYYDLVFRPALYRLLRAAERRLGALAWTIRARMNR